MTTFTEVVRRHLAARNDTDKCRTLSPKLVPFGSQAPLIKDSGDDHPMHCRCLKYHN